ncbi:MAG: glycosyltransferase [Deltaproteobacteria bacterium]
MSAPREKVSIIVPAYNEEAIIRPSLEEIVGIVDGPNIVCADPLKEIVAEFEGMGVDYEVIVMSDGSRDQTIQKAVEVARLNPRIKVKRSLGNYGKGRALKRAFRYCSGDLIVFLDADLDLHPSLAQNLINIMKWEKADVVIGSKFHPMSQVEYSLQRKLISFIYYSLIKLLFGLPLRDTQTGLKVFKRRVLEEVFPRILVKKFAFDLEVLAVAHHLGFKIAEAPIVLRQRRRYGRIGTRALWQTGWDTLAVFYRLNILRYYDKFPVRHRRARSGDRAGQEQETGLR